MNLGLIVARGSRQRGVSLIEAMVALAVMAIGMLGLVGIQSTLRSNSDLSKQRSEAIRLAQEAVEDARAFVSYTGTAPAYTDLANGAVTTSGLVGSSATFTRVRDISAVPGPVKAKTVEVTVTWQDRTARDANDKHSVVISTIIAGIAPELAATLAVPGEGDLIRQPGGRHRAIPVVAKDLGGGTSGFIPPGAPTGVAWRFDNTTALITLCTTTATVTADLVSGPSGNLTCSSNLAAFVAGFVNYAITASQPTAAQAAEPPSAAPVPAPLLSVDYTNATTTTVTNVGCAQESTGSAPGYTAFYCAVPVIVVTPGIAPTWSGSVRFGDNGAAVMVTTADAATDPRSDHLRACRYPATPASYSNASTPLVNQNYLVIAAGDRSPLAVSGGTVFTCPSPTLAFQPA